MIDFEQLSHYRENDQLEVKRAKGGFPKSLWETYSAFGNCKGGIILLGVDEDEYHHFDVVGVPDAQALIKQFWDTVNNPSKVSTVLPSEWHVYEQRINEKSVVVIEVPPADRRHKPVFINGNPYTGTYKRNGEGDYLCKQEEIISIIRDSSDSTADMTVLDEFGTEAINFETVKAYRNLIYASKPSHPWNDLNDLDFLTRLGTLVSKTDGKLHLTAGGLLMFGEDVYILRAFPGYFLDYREQLLPSVPYTKRIYSGSGEWSGNLFDFYIYILNALNSFIPNPFFLNRYFRVDENDLHRAVRESLLNCLVNADYFQRTGIVITCDGKEIQMRNPGSFRIDFELAKQGGISDPRNQLLFRFFGFLEVSERMGTGIYRTIRSWTRAGLPSPEYEISENPHFVLLKLGLKITEPLDEHMSEKELKDRFFEGDENYNATMDYFLENERRNKHKMKRTDKASQNTCIFDDHDKAVLKVLADHPDQTSKQIAKRLHVQPSVIIESLQKLINDHLVIVFEKNKVSKFRLL